MPHLFSIDLTVNYPCHLLSNSFVLSPFPETGEEKKRASKYNDLIQFSHLLFILSNVLEKLEINS